MASTGVSATTVRPRLPYHAETSEVDGSVRRVSRKQYQRSRQDAEAERHPPPPEFITATLKWAQITRERDYLTRITPTLSGPPSEVREGTTRQSVLRSE